MNRTVVAIASALVIAAVVLVAASLSRPAPASFSPTPNALLIDSATGARRITVDASNPAVWRFVSFREGRVVDRPEPLGWDLALRRFQIATNGGVGFAGQGAAGVLDPASNTSALQQTSADTTKSSFGKWYDYGFSSHLLTPKPQRYLVVAADGSRYSLQILSYYCPGAHPGCLTIEYRNVNR